VVPDNGKVIATALQMQADATVAGMRDEADGPRR
jgi:hypothetical protein